MRKRSIYIALLLLQCILLYHRAYAQIPSFLPDSIKKKINAWPESGRDTMLLDIGTKYYSTYNSDGYNKALDCFIASTNLAKKLHHRDVLFSGYRDIASVYDGLETDLNKAIYYYKLYYDTMGANSTNPEQKLYTAYYLAATYAKAGDSTDASHYVAPIDNILIHSKNTNNRNTYVLMLCYLMYSIHNQKAFIKYYEMLPPGIKFKDADLAYGQMYARIKSKYYLQKGMKKEAVKALEDELPYSNDREAIYSVLSATCASLKDYANAYKYKVLEDSEYFLKVNANIANDIKMKLLRSDNELQAQKNRVLQLQQEQLHQSNRMLGIIMTLLLSALGIAVFTYIKIRKQNTLLTTQKQQIELRDEHNQLLLKEIHHRVKNNLQIVNSLVELQQIKPYASVTSVIKEIQVKMNSMALAHAMLYEQQDLSVIPLREYFERLIDQVLPILSSNNHVPIISINIDAIRLDLDKAIPLALIINELLVNSVKYALPVTADCHISILAKQQSDMLTVSYSDNGPGISSDIDINKPSSIGLRLINRLARQLGAQTKIDNTAGNLNYSFTFKTDVSS